MAHTVSILLSTEDRAGIVVFLGDCKRPLKHVQRTRIIFLSANRLPVLEVARVAEVSRPSV